MCGRSVYPGHVSEVSEVLTREVQPGGAKGSAASSVSWVVRRVRVCGGVSEGLVFKRLLQVRGPGVVSAVCPCDVMLTGTTCSHVTTGNLWHSRTSSTHH
jgi:hypothetical protein